MESLSIINADNDMHGAKKENIFLALDENNELLGLLLIYPFFDYDIEPKHPHNLYLHFHVEQGKELREKDKHALLDMALQRAAEIKHEENQSKTRVYACFLKNQQDEIAYFLQQGFAHDEGMLIMERHGTADLHQSDMPEEIEVKIWEFETEAEQHHFIETHRKIFPRHPYSPRRLLELKSLPGWSNFSAFKNGEIVGNIMVFINPDDKSMGVIEDLFVLKRWRRRGIGRYLLYTALTYFQNKDISRVQLELWSANKNALQLYREFGFTSIDETEIAVGRYI